VSDMGPWNCARRSECQLVTAEVGPQTELLQRLGTIGEGWGEFGFVFVCVWVSSLQQKWGRKPSLLSV
jgi:hypothetical protein